MKVILAQTLCRSEDSRKSVAFGIIQGASEPFVNTTLNYYDHNRDRYRERTQGKLDLDALGLFVSFLPRGGLILDAGCGTGRDLRKFSQWGYLAEGVDSSLAMTEMARSFSGCKIWQADLRLLNLPDARYDGIWSHRSLIHLNADECRRAVATFFRAIKPRGILFVSLEEGTGSIEDRTDDPQGPARTLYRYRAEDFSSLLRQHGFTLLSVGRDSTRPERIALVSRRS